MVPRESNVNQPGYAAISSPSSQSRFVESADAALRAGVGKFTVLCVEFDPFHNLRDILGYGPVNQLLVEVSRRLRQHLMSPETLIEPVGCDQIAVLVGGGFDVDQLLGLATALQQALVGPYRVGAEEVRLASRIGLAIFPEHGSNACDLLQRAEWAMREAKPGDRRTVAVFDSERHAAAIDRIRMQNALVHAIGRRELELLYQPVVNMQGKMDGVEALVTWRHPERGLLPAGQFIPIAEETDLICDIGSWVLEQACLAGEGWRKAGIGKIDVSVNVSARQFERDDFVDTISAVLAMSGFPARFLELELTERSVMRELEPSAERLRRICDLGVSIAIDDFGTGYSSLSYLHQLPVDTVKIDQSFLRGIAQVDGSLPVVQGIVRLAHGMGLGVVAEGVETNEELELIRVLGCDMAQGHLFGRPLRIDEVGPLFLSQRGAFAAAVK